MVCTLPIIGCFVQRAYTLEKLPGYWSCTARSGKHCWAIKNKQLPIYIPFTVFLRSYLCESGAVASDSRAGKRQICLRRGKQFCRAGARLAANKI